MTGWMPIDSAPKDGTAILLFLPGDAYTLCGLTDGIVIGHWSAADLPADAPEHEDDDWYQIEQDDAHPIDIPPTHWMSLPDPPTVTP